MAVEHEIEGAVARAPGVGEAGTSARAPSGARAVNSLSMDKEVRIDEDVFNMKVRKFLKKVGVTSQREIEGVVRDALAAGRLKGDASVEARMTLSIEAVSLDQVIEGKIALR